MKDDTLRTLTFKTATSASGVVHGDLVLHVILGSAVTSHALQRNASVLVGRSRGADIVIDHPSVSRRHMRIYTGNELVVEDLGASNGVVVVGARVPPHGRVAIQPGVTVELGAAMVVVQRGAASPSPRRVWSHSYFEGRVEDECARAERTGGSFAVLRVRGQSEHLEEIISSALEPSDALARYGPSDLEGLLLERSSEQAEAVAKEVARRIAARGIEAHVAVACCPRDARSAGALLAAAQQAVEPRRSPGLARSPRSVLRPSLTPMLGALERVAAGAVSVLVTGETGTGKEVVAELIHRGSPRASSPLVKLNCAAFTETLLASELFGHERGAFTGADRAKPGILESADGGTVFLDELGEMPLSIQPKLLRVLEDRVVVRVGALRGKAIDVRFVAATNRDLEREVAEGRFREDLYWRLNGFQVHLPPLRETRGDIAVLVEHFLATAARSAGLRAAPELTPAAQELFAGYAWPGNVRELRNVIERAVLLSGGERIDLEHLPVDKMRARIVASDPLGAAVGEREKTRIAQALAQCGGNQTHAAKLLGIARGTLLSRMDQYGITRPRKR
jgi:DNA-binding NtrC family response regulator